VLKSQFSAIFRHFFGKKMAFFSKTNVITCTNFLQFLPILGEKMALFSKTNV
jgi:hypothetical protein